MSSLGPSLFLIHGRILLPSFWLANFNCFRLIHANLSVTLMGTKRKKVSLKTLRIGSGKIFFTYGKFIILSRRMPWKSIRFLGLLYLLPNNTLFKKEKSFNNIILIVVLKIHMHLCFNKECCSSWEVLSDLNLKPLPWFWLLFSLRRAQILECVYRSWPQMFLLTQKLENVLLEGPTASGLRCYKLGPGLTWSRETQEADATVSYSV